MEMIDKTSESRVEILVCDTSTRMVGWEKVDLIPGVKIVEATTLNDLVLEADATYGFNFFQNLVNKK